MTGRDGAGRLTWGSWAKVPSYLEAQSDTDHAISNNDRTGDVITSNRSGAMSSSNGLWLKKRTRLMSELPFLVLANPKAVRAFCSWSWVRGCFQVYSAGLVTSKICEFSVISGPASKGSPERARIVCQTGMPHLQYCVVCLGFAYRLSKETQNYCCRPYWRNEAQC